MLWIPRRRFLGAVGAALVPAAVGWTVWTTWTNRPRSRRTAVEALLHEREGARAIGVRYLDMAPEEGDAALLAERLFSRVVDPPRDGADVARLRQAISARRQDDFAVGDTVVIDGWILARTEARLCALAALS